MTGLTLLGHCLLLSSALDDVSFVKEFRVKLGQQNIWDGTLTAGSLSDKQKAILAEKKRVTPRDKAALLGTGFFKFTGLSREAMTIEEANFWGESVRPSNTGKGSARPSATATASSTAANEPFGDTTPPRRRAEPQNIAVTLADGSVVSIPRKVYVYYTTTNAGGDDALRDSIARRGAENFIRSYTAAMEADPEMRGRSGTTTMG
jgi:hypothetical protein